MDETTWQERLRVRYVRQVEGIASDLRELADRVERHRAPHGLYSDEAAWVLNDVMNALPNLRLSVLLEAARDVDNFASPDAEAET